MIRNTLHRGMIRTVNKWTYGLLEYEYITNIPRIRNQQTHVAWQIIPETFGEFTGRTDKNNVNIFEHDLFQVAGNKVYEVVYCDFDNSYDGEGIYCCFALFDKKQNTKIAFDDYAMKNGEVIGTIFDVIQQGQNNET